MIPNNHQLNQSKTLEKFKMESLKKTRGPVSDEQKLSTATIINDQNSTNIHVDVTFDTKAIRSVPLILNIPRPSPKLA